MDRLAIDFTSSTILSLCTGILLKSLQFPWLLHKNTLMHMCSANCCTVAAKHHCQWMCGSAILHSIKVLGLTGTGNMYALVKDTPFPSQHITVCHFPVKRPLSDTTIEIPSLGTGIDSFLVFSAYRCSVLFVGVRCGWQWLVGSWNIHNTNLRKDTKENTMETVNIFILLT